MITAVLVQLDQADERHADALMLQLGARLLQSDYDLFTGARFG